MFGCWVREIKTARTEAIRILPSFFEIARTAEDRGTCYQGQRWIHEALEVAESRLDRKAANVQLD